MKKGLMRLYTPQKSFLGADKERADVWVRCSVLWFTGLGLVIRVEGLGVMAAGLGVGVEELGV